MRFFQSLLCLVAAVWSTTQKVYAMEEIHDTPPPSQVIRKETLLKLRWLTVKSLELQYADGSKTKIPLTEASNIKDEPTPCLFTGKLEDDADSRVTVSGCAGDGEAAATIASVQVDGGVVDLVFTSTTTDKVGFTVSKDDLEKDDHPAHPANARDNRRSAMSIGDTKKSDIKLAWVKDKEEMEITFANRKKDKIILAKSNYQGVDVGCLFSGALESDHDSEVDVDGCMGNAETIVEIHSVLVPCGFVDLVLTKEDTYILEQDKEHIPNKTTNDFLVSPKSSDGPQAIVRPWPHAQLPTVARLETRIKYDEGLREVTGGKTQAKWFISRVVEHAKTRLHMLPIKVELSVVGTMQYVNQNWRAAKAHGGHWWIKELGRANTDKLVSHFCAGQGGGVAYLTNACGGVNSTNLNEHIRTNRPGRSEWITGRTYAHELGHNLGMRHDFDPNNEGRKPGSGGPCDGRGLMSYGSCKPDCEDSNMPDAWSACSINDFLETFRKKTHLCLAMPPSEGPSGCNCNGHMQRGYGQCQQMASCGAWCYVNNDNSCSYSYRSYIGSPFRWTCEACPGTRADKTELVAPPCPRAYGSASILNIPAFLVLSVASALPLK